MKALECDRCDYVAEGETFEDWMKALQPHYMAAHPEIINDPTKTQEDRERWITENRARFESASLAG